MQLKITSVAALSVAAVLASANAASADVLANYNFEEFTATTTTWPAAPGPYNNAASSSLGTASALTNVGAGALQAVITRDSTQVPLASQTLLIGAGNLASTSGSTEPPAPVSSTDYLGFTLTANNLVDLTSLTFDLGTSIGANQIATSNGVTFDNLETNARLFYSTDGGVSFTAVGQLIESTAVSTPDSGSFTGMNPYTIDLSSLSDLLAGQGIELRLGFTDNRGGASNTMAHYLDNVVLNGTVVPEPTSIAALGLAATGLLVRRRRA